MAMMGSPFAAIPRSALMIAGLIAAGSTSLPAAEQATADRSPKFRQCLRDSGGVTAAMQPCMADEYRRLDRALNIAYRDALRRLLGDTARSRLRDAQRSWLETRWDVCTDEVAQSGMAGGSGGQLVEGSCRLRVVSDRIDWLRAYPQPIPHGR